MNHLHPAYVAGIIDGEGSIFPRKRSPHISVANTSEALILGLAALGGSHRPRDPRRGLGKLPSWEWVVGGETAAIILRACLPYFVIKGAKAEAALALYADVTGSNSGHFRRQARERMNAEWLQWELGVGRSAA